MRFRKWFSALGALLMLATICVSSLMVVAEADHDCSGHDCPTCLEIRGCIGNLQLLGSSPAAGDAIPLPKVEVGSPQFAGEAHRPAAVTLRTLDVRFDE